MISQAVEKIPNLEHQFIGRFKIFLNHKVPKIRIIAAKGLTDFVKSARNKEEMFELFDIIYQDREDLPKLLTIECLLLLYPTNTQFVINKIRIMKTYRNWRF